MADNERRVITAMADPAAPPLRLNVPIGLGDDPIVVIARRKNDGRAAIEYFAIADPITRQALVDLTLSVDAVQFEEPKEMIARASSLIVAIGADLGDAHPDGSTRLLQADIDQRGHARSPIPVAFPEYKELSYVERCMKLAREGRGEEIFTIDAGEGRIATDDRRNIPIEPKGAV